MQDERHSNPFAYIFLVLPFGISNGFVSIALPFVLAREGLSVATAASIVALGLSANVWRFAGAPLVDLTFSLRRWYLLGLAACSVTLLLLGFMPLRAETTIALPAIAFLSQVGSNFVVIPVGGFIAHTVVEDQKGRAAGWYQAGNLDGTGLGGGAGVWLASHYSFLAASATLAGAMLLGGLALRFVPDVRPILGETIGHRLRLMGKDLLALWRTPLGLITTIFVTVLIGAGAMNNLWSAVAPDWESCGNIPVIYMTSFDGWAHDRFSTAGMLWMEALAGIVCVALGLVAVAWLQPRPATR